MDEKTTYIEDVTDIVGSDLAFIERNLKSDPDGFWARTLIKTVASYFEAGIFILKQNLLDYCNRNGKAISPEVEVFLRNKKYELGNDGKLKERILQSRVGDEVKFVFEKICELKGHTQAKGYDSEGWSKLIDTVAVRNRLTHPKSIEDLNVTKKEVEDGDTAFEWYIDNVVEFIRQDRLQLEKELKILKSKVGPLASMIAGNIPDTSPN